MFRIFCHIYTFETIPSLSDSIANCFTAHQTCQCARSLPKFQRQRRCSKYSSLRLFPLFRKIWRIVPGKWMPKNGNKETCVHINLESRTFARSSSWELFPLMIKILARYREFLLVKWNSVIVVLDIKMVVKYCFALNVSGVAVLPHPLSTPSYSHNLVSEATKHACFPRQDFIIAVFLSALHNGIFSFLFAFNLTFLCVLFIH